MEASFWHQKWARGEIAFHQSEANPLLVAHFQQLKLPQGRRVFLPLCGKTRDFAWLLANGYRVAGVELSDIAIKELFDGLGLTPTISPLGKLTRYSADAIDIFVGDIFELSADVLGEVSAIYDRAALVALPVGMRKLYTAHLMAISQCAPQLLVTYEYDQQQLEGPPFSISDNEVAEHYAATYLLEALERMAVVGGLREIAAKETVWLLQSANT
ncbi:thiopurine S-methyltransferase [Methylosoma difficile]